MRRGGGRKAAFGHWLLRGGVVPTRGFLVVGWWCRERVKMAFHYPSVRSIRSPASGSLSHALACVSGSGGCCDFYHA